MDKCKTITGKLKGIQNFHKKPTLLMKWLKVPCIFME